MQTVRDNSNTFPQRRTDLQHPVDVLQPIRNRPVPLPWFFEIGVRTYARNVREGVRKFLHRDTRSLPTSSPRWASSGTSSLSPFSPAGPVVRARIIAITMNSCSYYPSVAPPPKWRLGASYRARRTHSVCSSFYCGACAAGMSCHVITLDN